MHEVDSIAFKNHHWTSYPQILRNTQAGGNSNIGQFPLHSKQSGLGELGRICLESGQGRAERQENVWWTFLANEPA